MNAPNGTRNGGGDVGADQAAVADARPLVLVRHRSGVVADSARLVHFVPLPLLGQRPAAVTALCGMLLNPTQIERVIPGQGVPCEGCMVSHVAGAEPTAPDTPPSPVDLIDPEITPAIAAETYQSWGWPVLLRRERIWLALGLEVVALLVPVPLAVRVIAILSARRCPPAVLSHPDAPKHQVFLAGEPYGVGLGWPNGVYRVSGTVLLPPTETPRGPVTWAHPLHPRALRLTREIDLASALRTAQTDPPPSDPTPDAPTAF